MKFKEKGLIRILLGVDRAVAIGAIIKSGLFEKSSLEKAVDDLVDILMSAIPDMVLALIQSVVPNFVLELKLFIIALTWKWLTLLPGDPPEIEITPFVTSEVPEDLTPGIYGGDHELVTQKYYDSLTVNYETSIDNYNKLLEDYNKLLEDYNKLDDPITVDPVTVTGIPKNKIVAELDLRVRDIEQAYPGTQENEYYKGVKVGHLNEIESLRSWVSNY